MNRPPVWIRKAASRSGERSPDCDPALGLTVFGKRRARNGKKAGPPAHDDLVRRRFKTDAPNRLWLWDITEHPTADQGRANRIVGYSISDRMKSRIAVGALLGHLAILHHKEAAENP